MPNCCALIRRKWQQLFGRKARNQSKVRLDAEEETSSSDSEKSGTVQKWSRTMVGYGPEDAHFALQLTYNYNAQKFVPDCSLRSITVCNSDTLTRAQQQYWIVQPGSYLNDPNGYRFQIRESAEGKAQFDKITLICTDLKRAMRYWNGMLEMNVFRKTEDSLCLAYRAGQIKLELKKIYNVSQNIDCRPGRIVFGCPKNQQDAIEQRIMDNNYTILAPLQIVSIPGHQPIRIMVLEDPDGHEIAFVDEDNYNIISQPIPGSEELLRQQIELKT